jgi:hypothetical protein
MRHLEHLSARSYRELVEPFKRFKCSKIDDGRRVFWQRMKLDIVVPPTTWETWIEVERRAAKSREKGPELR